MLVPNWRIWHQDLTSNEQGNKNIQAFINSLGSDEPDNQKVRTLTEDVNRVFLAANSDRLINIFHSPKNL